MSVVCTICRHPERSAIEVALVAGDPVRAIAARHSTSTGALQRHKQHAVTTLAKARDAREVSHADTLLEKLGDLEDEARAILNEARGRGQDGKAEAPPNPSIALKAIDRLVDLIELMAKLRGELQSGSQTTVNVLAVNAPDWQPLAQALLRALQPYPEALLAASAALEAHRHG